MFTFNFNLYYNHIALLPFIFILFNLRLSDSISISPSNLYTSNANQSKGVCRGFYSFINPHHLKDSFNNHNSEYKTWCLFAKPIFKSTPIPKSRLPKHIPLDYENLLRCHDPSLINYNTRLTDFPGINIREIDDLYGRIYDRKVLMKQLRYFLEMDDFNSIPRLMKDNRDVLNKRDCQLLADDFDHLLFSRLKYEYPEPENMDRMMPFLVSRYVLQHVLQQDLQSKLNYIWLKPGEIPEDVPDFDKDYQEPPSSPENPIHVKDTYAYRSLIHRLKGLDDYTRLYAIRELYHKMVDCKRKKLIKCLKRFHRLKPFKSLGYRHKVKNKLNVDRISPFLSRPARCTDEIINEYTSHFEDAVNKEDLATACRLLNRYSRRIIFIDKLPLLRKFMKLFANVHACRKYDLKCLETLRRYYWSTVRRRQFLIRYNEPLMIRDAGKTMKDLYEEQLENYRKRRDKKYDEKLKKMGIDMDEVRDFSNAYGQDWIPILYPEEYQEALKVHEERLEKIRRKVEKVRIQEMKKKRFSEGLDDDDDELEDLS